MEMVIHELKQSPDLFQEGLRYALSFCPRHNTSVNVLSILEHAVSQTPGRRTRTPTDMKNEFADIGAASRRCGGPKVFKLPHRPKAICKNRSKDLV